MTAEEVGTIISDKLKTIKIEDDFETDMGLKVLRGRRQILASDIPCVVIVEGDDGIKSREIPSNGMDRGVQVNQHYILEGYAFCDEDHPNDTAHKIIRDLKKSIFKSDAALFPMKLKWWRYMGRLIGERSDGTKAISAYIELEVGFSEDLQNP
jgi:hypothetical protein